MPYLSRDDIEIIAESIICQYKKRYLPERRMCYMVEATELAEMLGFRIEYVQDPVRLGAIAKFDAAFFEKEHLEHPNIIEFFKSS